MNFLPGVSLVKILVYAAIVLGLMAAGARLEHNRMQPKLDKVTAEYNQFKGGVAVLGRAATIAAEKQKLADIKAKERTDEQSKVAVASNRTAIKRVRDANDARRGGLRAAPAGSECPAAWICFDAAAFERADGERRSAVRGLADEGTEVGIRLKMAIEWANP